MWAEYSIKRLKPLQTLQRFDDNRLVRFYYYLTGDGEVKIQAGVTSVLGLVSTERKAIDTWKEKNENWKDLLDASAEYGSMLHTQYGRILLGEPVDKTVLQKMREVAVANGQSYDMASKDILAFLKFKEDYNVKPLIVEGMLLWTDADGESLAMTIDLLCEFSKTTKVKTEVEDGKYVRGANKGKPKFKTVVTETVEKQTVLIDFKSNFFEKDKKTFYEAHTLQLLVAKLAVEQNFDIKVDAVLNYSGNAWRVEPSYTLYEHKLEDKDYKVFDAYWNLAKAKGLNVPTGKILLTDDFQSSSDYKYLDYPTYVKEVLLKEEMNKDGLEDRSTLTMAEIEQMWQKTKRK